MKLSPMTKSFTEEPVKSWFITTKDQISSYEEFKIEVLGSILV